MSTSPEQPAYHFAAKTYKEYKERRLSIGRQRAHHLRLRLVEPKLLSVRCSYLDKSSATMSQPVAALLEVKPQMTGRLKLAQPKSGGGLRHKNQH